MHPAALAPRHGVVLGPRLFRGFAMLAQLFFIFVGVMLGWAGVKGLGHHNR